MGRVCGPPDNISRFRLRGPSASFDPRVTAVRDDLCDLALAGRFFAPHYAAAIAYRCTAPSVMIRAAGADASQATSQLLFGEIFDVLEFHRGWAWGRCRHDGYVGYVVADALGTATDGFPTHRVKPGGAILFSAPDIKSPHVAMLPSGAALETKGEAGPADAMFLATAGGHVHRRHIMALGESVADLPTVARGFLGMPYLWGGRGGGGIDCSGLVQIALGLCGHTVQRDSDQQAASVGRALGPGEPMLAGDIVFFPGHVGIMTDADTIIHANAHWMAVVEEPLANVLARMAPHAPDTAAITARRRIEP